MFVVAASLRRGVVGYLVRHGDTAPWLQQSEASFSVVASLCRGAGGCLGLRGDTARFIEVLAMQIDLPLLNRVQASRGPRLQQTLATASAEAQSPV